MIRTFRTIEARMAAIRRAQEDRLPLFISLMEEEDLLRRARRTDIGLFDFDGTLTPVNQWDALRALVPEELRRTEPDLLSAYRQFMRASLNTDDFHASGPRSEAHLSAWEAQWVESSASLFARGGLTREQVATAGAGIPLRDGAKALLSLFAAHTAVISMGMEDTIRPCLAAHGVPAHVVASRLRYDEDNRVQGVQMGAVTAAMKGDIREWYLFHHVRMAEHDRVLAIGDSRSDRPMMRHGSGLNAFILPFAPPGEPHAAYRDENLVEILSIADIVLVGDSLQPLADLIEDARTVVP